MAAIIREEREAIEGGGGRLGNPLARDNDPGFSDDEEAHPSNEDEDDLPLCMLQHTEIYVVGLNHNFHVAHYVTMLKAYHPIRLA